MYKYIDPSNPEEPFGETLVDSLYGHVGNILKGFFRSKSC